ncbi:MAG TPA: hypothetical protein VFI33_09625 [Puia sp.]|nr:hypothetical protein [Puia sp.]
MISGDQIEIARNNWLKAAEELDFNITTPFEILVGNVEKEVFGYLPDYGSQNGAIVELMEVSQETDNTLSDWARDNKVFLSYCNINTFLVYDVSYFREILKDWKIIRSNKSE